MGKLARMEVAVMSLLGASLPAGCAHTDRPPVEVAVAEVGSVKVVEPASPPAEPVSSEQDQEDPKPAGLDQFETWAGDNIRFAFSSRPQRSDACFDSSGLEVSCVSPTAVRQETKVWEEIAGTVVNRSDAPVRCETSVSTKETAILPQGTHTFSIHTKPRTADAERETVYLRCTMPVKEAITVGALPANNSEKSVGVEVSFGNGSRTIFLGKRTITSKVEDGPGT